MKNNNPHTGDWAVFASCLWIYGAFWKHAVHYFLRPVSLHSNGVCLFWDNDET